MMLSDPPNPDQHLLTPADLASELEQLREAVNQERERHVRTLADFKNYRRRIDRDIEKLSQAGLRPLLHSLLDVMDDMEKALRWTGSGEDAMVNGVRNLSQKLSALLAAQGVRAFESKRKPFTPQVHDAIAVAKESGVAPGTVVEVLREG